VTGIKSESLTTFIGISTQIRMLFGDAASAISYFAGANHRRGRSHFQEVFWQLDRISRMREVERSSPQAPGIAIPELTNPQS